MSESRLNKQVILPIAFDSESTPSLKRKKKNPFLLLGIIFVEGNNANKLLMSVGPLVSVSNWQYCVLLELKKV